MATQVSCYFAVKAISNWYILITSHIYKGLVHHTAFQVWQQLSNYMYGSVQGRFYYPQFADEKAEAARR